MKGPDLNILLTITGIGQEKAKRAVQNTLGFSPDLVISTGFAGALKEGIGAGDLVLDSSRSDPRTSGILSALSEKYAITVHRGAFFSQDKTLFTREEKMRGGENNGAIAVEMESRGIHDLCREKKIPFCSLRAVSDTLDQDLPLSVGAWGAEGGVSGRFLAALFFRPREWKSFFRLFRSSRKAERSLSAILTLLMGSL